MSNHPEGSDMPERDRYPAGVPCWIDTTQPDPEAGVAFYSGLFGWEFRDAMPPGSPGSYFIGSIRGGDVAAVGAQPQGAPPLATWNTYVCVDSADEAAARVRDAGGRVVTDPFDVMEAGRMAVFTDPEGAAFCVWQPGETIGAQVVNEHGSLNFNVLNTRDPEGARSFYGAVFGWQTLPMGGPAEAWTLPGYGDHLEERTPGMRRGMEEMGAPKGFEDVVASLLVIPDGQPDVPHWSVTFAADDADEVAARAEELGGTVLVRPFDAPWVRTTVIADPAGATFTASKFVPENKDLGSPAASSASAA
jgi:predicted enzyme related to lactoylglutathione lyase